MAALMDELIEECLLRLPPEDPASLVRAALVCQRWRRLISGHGFRRRFHELHRTPPLLGFVETLAGFVSTSSFRASSAKLVDWLAIHSCHGRVLLYHSPRQNFDPRKNRLLVWDLMKGCDHLHCRRVSFLVIFMGSLHNKTVTSVYSSDADAWSEPTSTQKRFSQFHLATRAIAGNALYFNDIASFELLKYDLTTRDVSTIHLPDEAFLRQIVPMAVDHSRLGLATVHESMLHLWSTEVGPNKDAIRWEQSRVIELDTILPADVLSSHTCLSGYADGGTVIFLWTSTGFLCVDLKSRQIKKVGGGIRFCNFVVPIMSFCTPALGAACTGEASGADA